MIYIGPFNVKPSIAEHTRTLLESADGVQAAIAFLREQGESKIGSIRALVAVGGMTLREAKRVVHCSATWRDKQSADEALHQSLEETLQLIQATDSEAALQLARAR